MTSVLSHRFLSFKNQKEISPPSSEALAATQAALAGSFLQRPPPPCLQITLKPVLMLKAGPRSVPPPPLPSQLQREEEK